MPAAIPIVEIADDGNAPRIGSPDGEVETFDALELQRMRAHPVEESEMRSFADEIIVHGAENRAEAVRVGHRPFCIVAAGAIPHRLSLRKIDPAFEKAIRIEPLQFAHEISVQRQDGNLLGAGNETAGGKPFRRFVNAENGKGIGMQTALDRLDFSLRDVASLFLFGRIERFFHQALQISVAYWRIVRSDENQPIRAVLRTVLAYQLSGSLQIASTSRCALA